MYIAASLRGWVTSTEWNGSEFPAKRFHAGSWPLALPLRLWMIYLQVGGPDLASLCSFACVVSTSRYNGYNNHHIVCWFLCCVFGALFFRRSKPSGQRSRRQITRHELSLLSLLTLGLLIITCHFFLLHVRTIACKTGSFCQELSRRAP